LFHDVNLNGQAHAVIVRSSHANARIVRMEIDTDTGQVDLLRYAVVDDVGTVINPVGLKGQIHGGIAQGVDQALMEQVVYDPDNG